MAAAAYWSAWSRVAVMFARRDLATVAPHWLSFGQRSSPLTGSPRLAANPANAILNYLYALLESEASIAARVVGLDAGLGVLHADQAHRDSLSADLMEPVRPLVDRYLLDLLSTRTFAVSDFYETRQGGCRITPPLARELAETLPRWRVEVGRVAETVAGLLAGDIGGMPTPITGSRRAAARPDGARPARRHRRPRRGCSWCGGRVEPGRATCSAACAAATAAEHLPAFVAAGAAAVHELRSVGWTPLMTPQGKERLGRRTSALVEAAREWQRTHPWPEDMGRFARDIAPQLVALPSRALAEATGLTVAYCRRVQRGEVVPHPMWWEAFEALVSLG